MEKEVAELTIAEKLVVEEGRGWGREGGKELERKSRASPCLQHSPDPCQKIIPKLHP